MEKVWEDIGLAPLHHDAAPAAATHHEVSLQDFLSGPVSSEDPVPPGNLIINNNDSHDPSPSRCGGGATVFGSLQLPPATALSLRQGSTEFRYLRSPNRTRSHPQSPTPFDGGALSFITSSAFSFPSARKKGAWEINGDNPSDPRHKRMIKNRASADRSRARKQAYRTGLEKEVARLRKENAMLRRHLPLEKLGSAAPGQIRKEDNSLHRTLTAPF